MDRSRLVYKYRTHDVITLTGGNMIEQDILNQNYMELLASIYQLAFYDVFESKHVTVNNRNYDIIKRNGADAMAFLKDNPYGMQINVDQILNRMENEDFVQKKGYYENDLWDL